MATSLTAVPPPTGDTTKVAVYSGVHGEAGETVADQTLLTGAAGRPENIRGGEVNLKVSVLLYLVLYFVLQHPLNYTYSQVL